MGGINIRIGHLSRGCLEQIVTHLGALEVRVVVPNRHGPIKSIEVKERSFSCAINEPWTLASLQIDNDPKTIHEHVLLEG